MLTVIPLGRFLKVSILNTIIITGTSAIIYFITLFILKDDTLINIIKKFKDKIKSKKYKNKQLKANIK